MGGLQDVAVLVRCSMFLTPRLLRLSRWEKCEGGNQLKIDGVILDGGGFPIFPHRIVGPAMVTAFMGVYGVGWTCLEYKSTFQPFSYINNLPWRSAEEKGLTLCVARSKSQGSRRVWADRRRNSATPR